MLSITTSRPLGVVTVVCNPQSKIVDYVKVIIGIIACGNSIVLIHATNDEVAERIKTFCQRINLPKGSVNFLNYDHLSNIKDFFHGKSYSWLYLYDSHVTDDNIIHTAFKTDITKFNATMFRWFTEPKSVLIPVK